MRNDSVSPSSAYLNKKLLTTGAGLLAIGGLLGFAGMALAGAAVLSATRQWVGQMEVSPREMAALRWRQAKQASLAGAHAWRETTAAGR
jgi:hypothetical protein